MFILFSQEPTENNLESLDIAVTAGEDEAIEMQARTGYSVYRLVKVE